MLRAMMRRVNNEIAVFPYENAITWNYMGRHENGLWRTLSPPSSHRNPECSRIVGVNPRISPSFSAEPLSVPTFPGAQPRFRATFLRRSLSLVRWPALSEPRRKFESA